ncbi:hypothetical protein Q7C36_009860 [Tachysurus vachellii]|uniref:Uncharacterized protein n=1 Tax=Tachysurus vachellii TaxID=175792 RepID=A0AA88MYU3_TACVA|nr:hypothetical protein Q7C36_009860 [Tachysurus vachellii]
MPAVTPEVPSSSTTPSPNVATVASSMPLRASSPVTPFVVSKPEPEPSSSAMDTTFSPVSIRFPRFPSTQKLAQESTRQRAGKEGKSGHTRTAQTEGIFTLATTVTQTRSTEPPTHSLSLFLRMFEFMFNLF